MRRRRNPASWAHGTMRYGHRINAGPSPRNTCPKCGRPASGGRCYACGWGLSRRGYRHNPGFGGLGIGTLALLGGAAFVLLTPQGKAMLSSFGVGGPSAALPPGYTTVGRNLYRGPDGALYARNPTTGAMVKAPSGTVPTSGSDLLAKAGAIGVSLIPTVGAKVADWLGGLFSSQHSATTVIGEAGTVPSGVYIDPGASPFMTQPPIDFGAESWWDAPLYDTIPTYDMPLDVVDFGAESWWDAPVDFGAASWWDAPVDVPAGFFGLGSVQSIRQPRLGLQPGLVPLPWEVEWRTGPKFIRRPASRL